MAWRSGDISVVSGPRGGEIDRHVAQRRKPRPCLAETTSTQRGVSPASSGLDRRRGRWARSERAPSRTRTWKPSSCTPSSACRPAARRVSMVAATSRRSAVTGRSTPARFATAVRPGSRGVHHRAGRDRTPGGPHRGDPAAGIELGARDLGAPLDPHPEPARGGEVAFEQSKRAQEPVGGAERAADHAVEPRVGIEASGFLGRHLGRLGEPRPRAEPRGGAQPLSARARCCARNR